MKNLTFILILFITISSNFYAQKGSSSPGYWLYKGTIGEKESITLYLKIMDNDCRGELDPIGMYKYDDRDQWVALSMTMTEKQDFCMIECPYTGLMILKREGASFTGVWISPDRQKLVPVKLKQTSLSSSEKKQMEETLDQLFYELNDC